MLLAEPVFLCAASQDKLFVLKYKDIALQYLLFAGAFLQMSLHIKLR